MQHAEAEHKNFLEIKKLEHLGVKVDLDLFYLGEYDEYKEQTSQITPRKLNKAISIKQA